MPTNYKVNGTDIESFFVGRANTSLAYTPSALYGWGWARRGSLGLDYVTYADYESAVFYPDRVKPYNDWTAIKASYGYTSFGIRADGTLWSWGNSSLGLGYPNTVNQFTPKKVNNDTDWSILPQYSMGPYHNGYAIKTTGTLWAWGDGSSTDVYGPYSLPFNDRTNRITPVQVGNFTDWKQVEAADRDAIAVRTGGQMYTWGRNSNGGLGDNTRTHRSSPTQVGALTDWSQVTTGWEPRGAIKTNGTLWTWGENSKGQLAVGDRTHRSSPVQVGALTDWSQLAAGGDTFAAIKTNGTLWGWGDNGYGSIGDGTTTSRSSPVQIGALTNWSKLTLAPFLTLALKTDGTLWGWGSGSYGAPLTSKSYGQLAITTAGPASPIQVTDWNDWKLVSTGYYHVLGVRNQY